MKPSQYQSSIYNLVKSKPCHLLVNAKAGSGKTTTLKGIINTLDSSLQVLNLAFNKSIANEMKEKLPSWVNVRTCHSAGMSILCTSKNGRPSIDDRKYNDLAKLLLPTWNLDMNLDFDQDRYRSIIKMSKLVRMSLCENDNIAIMQLSNKHRLIFAPEDVLHVQELVETGNHPANSTIDFADMVYLPVRFPERYRIRKYDYVLIDECQDLSKAQQELVKLLVKESGIMIFVGDPQQAIYGFAGADAESFQQLRQIPGIIEMPLNECYRCAPEIIDFVQSIVPTIEAFKGNANGIVDFKASVDDIQDSDMVLCRNTMPLVLLCYKLIGEGKAAYIRGIDVRKQLIALIKKSNKQDLKLLHRWLKKYLSSYLQKLCKARPDIDVHEVRESPAYVMASEKVSIINHIIINSAKNVYNVETLIKEIENIFSDQKKGICLSTVHKAKGLESDRVFIIDRQLMPSKYAKEDWQIQQEKNIEYVAYTRAKTYLGFVHDWSSENVAERDEVEIKKEAKLL